MHDSRSSLESSSLYSKSRPTVTRGSQLRSALALRPDSACQGDGKQVGAQLGAWHVTSSQSRMVAVQSPPSGWAAASCGYMCRLVEQELHCNQGLGIAGALMRAWGVTDVNREARVSSASIVMPAVLSRLRAPCSMYEQLPCNVHPAMPSSKEPLPRLFECSASQSTLRTQAALASSYAPRTVLVSSRQACVGMQAWDPPRNARLHKHSATARAPTVRKATGGAKT